MNVPQNPVKQILGATDDVGESFHAILERAFILVLDPPVGIVIKLYVQDPVGENWYDISSGSGVRFDTSDFEATATRKASLKFFHAAPFMNYRLATKVEGARAFLTYSVPVPGLKE